MKKKLVILCSLLILCLLISLNLSAVACFERYNHIVTFGDSLSDNGNADGYGLDEYVLTNGKVWVEYVAEEMGASLEDRAIIGAKTHGHIYSGCCFGLDWQVDLFIQELSDNSKQVDDNTLFIIWAGANDFLALFSNNNSNIDISDIIENAIYYITSSIQNLIQVGAKDILVMNLPDLAATPLMDGNPIAHTISVAFNTYLEQAMCQLFAENPTVRFYMVDVFELIQFVIDNPARFGFTNVTEAGDESNNWEGFLFWDEIHPTTKGHQVVAAAALAQVAPPFSTSLKITIMIWKMLPIHPYRPYWIECCLN